MANLVEYLQSLCEREREMKLVLGLGVRFI